jgi:hypothetical protein
MSNEEVKTVSVTVRKSDEGNKYTLNNEDVVKVEDEKIDNKTYKKFTHEDNIYYFEDPVFNETDETDETEKIVDATTKKPVAPEAPEAEQEATGGKRRRTSKKQVKGGKRKGNEWTKLVTKTYKTNHKKNKSYTFKNAIQDARKVYKKV